MNKVLSFSATKTPDNEFTVVHKGLDVSHAKTIYKRKKITCVREYLKMYLDISPISICTVYKYVQMYII